jgi:hypothetical protein
MDKAPVITLQGRAVVARRVTEGQIRARPAIGRPQRAHGRKLPLFITRKTREPRAFHGWDGEAAHRAPASWLLNRVLHLSTTSWPLAGKLISPLGSFGRPADVRRISAISAISSGSVARVTRIEPSA